MFNFPAEERSTLWWCSVYGDQQYVTLTLKYLYQRNLDPPIVMTKMEPKTLIFQPSCNVFEPPCCRLASRVFCPVWLDIYMYCTDFPIAGHNGQKPPETKKTAACVYMSGWERMNDSEQGCGC